MKKRIVILVHERTRLGFLNRWLRRGQYFVAQLVPHWREAGWETRVSNDPTTPVPGDLLFVHVDLSVVPETYLALARHYPASVNAAVRDIRKSVISRQLVGPHDPWDGPVIVKTDLNHSGFPEARCIGTGRARSAAVVKKPGDYPLFPHLRAVPVEYFANPELVIERFLPERMGDLYRVRCYTFLGDQEDTLALYSHQPVVKAGNITRMETIEAHPEIRAMRQALGFDYGKFDYVVHDGRAILLDANKTLGRLPVHDAATADMVRRRAQGIRTLFA